MNLTDMIEASITKNLIIPAKPKKGDDRSHLIKIRSVAEADIKDVERLILTGFDSDIKLVRTIGSHMISLGGKLLRPITVVLIAKALGYDGKDHCKLGAAVELVHAGTLLHDDVVDQSALRRGKVTANKLWGNSASVLVGDYIFSRSLQHAADLNIPRVIEVMAYAIRRITEGEIMQLLNLRDTATSESQYFATIERKTAVLFEASAQLGAVISHSSPAVEAQLAKFGNLLGMAFQLCDDILDYSGDIKSIGKQVGDDLTEGNLTMPLIRALEVLDKKDKKKIYSALKHPNEADIDKIIQIVVSCGAVEYTKRLAHKYSRQAVQQLDHLPDTIYRDALVDLTDFVITRSY